MYSLCVLLSKHSYDSSKKYKYVSKCWMLLVETVFCKSNVIQGLSNSAADLHKWSLFSASPGPPTREVESRSSPQAPRVGTSASSLPGTCRESGESFTTLSAPLRVTFSLHCSIGDITCVLAQWLYIPVLFVDIVLSNQCTSCLMSLICSLAVYV